MSNNKPRSRHKQRTTAAGKRLLASLAVFTLMLGAVSIGTARPAAAPPNATIPLAVQVASGYFHSCALLDNGTIECWGVNRFGQLGNGVTTESNVPMAVAGIVSATQIVAGSSHTCALLEDRTVKCWGYNHFGQLGDGTTTNTNTPVTVTGIGLATQVSAGSSFSCALLDGGVKCWGSNGYGELGNGSTLGSEVAAPVTGITSATQISGGGNHACALLDDGTVQCWGSGVYGQLGDGTATDSAVPVTTADVSTATQVSTGNVHSCALLDTDTLQCWGSNELGQLGDGTWSDALWPVTVVGMGGYTNCRHAPVNPAFGTDQATNATVYRLYCAYFLRYPDTGGFQYWLTEFEAGRVGLGGISDLCADSKEFRLTYGHLSNHDFLWMVYNNVMEREPDTDGLAYWLNLINNGTISRGDVMLYFAESQEFRNRTGT